ncbi:MAG: tetratricopeptide repeat protein [Polyangiaceae bacterium]|jgi:TPR repeat protein
MKPAVLAAFAVLALGAAACGEEFSLAPAAQTQETFTFQARPAAPDPIEVAAKPCKFGDVARCIDQCQTGTASSCNALGVMFEYGRSATPDPTIASGFYARACDREYAPGCTNLAWLYSLGRGVPRDPQQAMLLFTRAFDQSRLACRRGDGHGCLMAGELLLQGQVTSSDETEELAMFQAACDKGEPRGCDYVTALR